MTRKGDRASQQALAAQTLRTLRHIRERDDRHAAAIESGTIEEWRVAWGYASIGGTEQRLQQLQQAGLVWNDGGIWRREEDAERP